MGGIIMELTQEILKELYSEATRQTLDTLPEFIKHVMNDYELDYNTVVDAVAICAIAGAHTADSCDKGGITGFQASGVMWRFIFNWMYPNNRVGMRLINFDDMLYPQYESKFDKLISKRTFEELQEVAKEMIEKSKQSLGFAAPVVLEHWKSIVDGIVPFGYKLKEE